ncbi:MAG: hypothetical protein FJW22_05320 [Acidimicrobiia bacterium]|nr:hypothetical protein [Acidimicrobiia bacterium]
MRLSLAVIGLVALFAAPAGAQGTFPPASSKNLQVLPKNSNASVVVGTMRGFAANLGVRCQFCHVGKEGMPLDQFDVVSDDIPQKRTARTMLRLTEAINQPLDAPACLVRPAPKRASPASRATAASRPRRIPRNRAVLRLQGCRSLLPDAHPAGLHDERQLAWVAWAIG